MRGILVGATFLSSAIWAAIPPLDPETRQLYASHIVDGRVVDVQKTLEDARGGHSEFKDWHFVAQIRVSKFVKAELFSDQEAEKVWVKYWKPAKRPSGWSGPQGQNDRLSVGEDVQLYMTRTLEPDVYDLITPNGIEKLSVGQQDYTDELDSEIL